LGLWVEKLVFPSRIAQIRNTMYFRQFLLLLITAISNQLRAQTELPNFRQVGTREGLPEGVVHAIHSDKQGIIWIASYEGLYRYSGGKCVPIYSQGKEDTTSLSSQRVFSILEDHQGSIWVGTSVGLNRMDRKTGKFKRFLNLPGKNKQLPDNSVIRIFEDSKNQIWVSTKKGIAKFHENNEIFESIHLSDSQAFVCYTSFESGGKTWFAGNGDFYYYDKTKNVLQRVIVSRTITGNKKYPVISSITDNKGNTWVGTYRGIFKFDSKNDKLIHAGFPDTLLNHNKITSFLLTDNHLWIGSSIGLIDWDQSQNTYKGYSYMANNPMGLSTSYIQSIAKDNNGNIWAGTSLNAAIFQTAYKPITFYTVDPQLPLNDADNHTARLFEDHLGGIWTWNHRGVLRSAGIGKEMKKIPGTPFAYFLEYFLEIEYHNKPLILMAYSSPGHGIYQYNSAANRIEKFPLNARLDKMNLYQIHIDKKNKNKLWIGTLEGICIYDLQTRDTSWIRFGGKKTQLRSFRQLEDGRWILLSPLGYGFYDETSNKQELFLYDANKKNMFHSGLIRDFAMGKNGAYWLGTETGLTYFNPATGKYLNYTTNNGLKGGNIIYAMHADKFGTCWFVTNSYLIRHDPVTNKFQYFNSSNGIFTTFNRWSICELRNGNVLFGGINGFISFNPEKLQANPVFPKIILTHFQVRNQERHYGLFPEFIQEVKVGYQENAITFEFIAQEYASPEKNEYAYQMEGFDTGWIYSGNEHRATYTNLSPGTYYFLAKCTNSEGIWSKDVLKIKVIITPLYYQSWWFRLLILAGFGVIIWLFWKNRNQKRKLEQQKAIAEQNSIYKSKFLTNMSHEIRTPMNAIIGLSRLLLDTDLNEKQKQYAEAVQQSSENLLWIVNDILDQAKIESGKYTIVNKPFQLDVILKQIHNLLQIKAKEKGIEFKVEIYNNAPVKLVGDPVRLYQILTNLVANAIKFTQTGYVHLFVESISSNREEASLRFMVKDSGIGIPREKIDQIFESFNQLIQDENTHSGTGLGLAIARELTQQLGGTISVESELNTGSTFTVTLPFKIDTQTAVAVNSGVKHNKSDKMLHILLVDDTRFNILLAQELLSEQFPRSIVDTAENGKIAIEKIQSNGYDLILMDVKMPVMDGIEATKWIRNANGATFQNIPVLGLTANAIPEQLEECFAAGMNDYLTKPVNASELFDKIIKLTP